MGRIGEPDDEILDTLAGPRPRDVGCFLRSGVGDLGNRRSFRGDCFDGSDRHLQSAKADR